MQHIVAHGRQCLGVVGQINALFLHLVEQRLGAARQGAGVIALGLEALEYAPQRGGHIEVVGADIVPPRRVVVVDQCDAFVGIVFVL